MNRIVKFPIKTRDSSRNMLNSSAQHPNISDRNHVVAELNEEPNSNTNFLIITSLSTLLSSKKIATSEILLVASNKLFSVRTYITYITIHKFLHLKTKQVFSLFLVIAAIISNLFERVNSLNRRRLYQKTVSLKWGNAYQQSWVSFHFKGLKHNFNQHSTSRRGERMLSEVVEH